MKEAITLAEQRRANLAKARKVKAERHAAGIGSADVRRLDALIDATAALAASQAKLIGANQAQMIRLIEATTEHMRLSQLLTRLLVEHPFAKVAALPEATAALVEAVKALVEAHTAPDREAMRRYAAENYQHEQGWPLNRLGEACPDHPEKTWVNDDGSKRCTHLGCAWGWKPATVEGFTFAQPPREHRDEVAAHEAFVQSLALLDVGPVPHGTDFDPEPAYDPASIQADMALELAEMAAEATEDEESPMPPDEGEVWSRRLATFRSLRLWHPSWGPRPGQDGCLVPYEMTSDGGGRR